MKPVFSLAQLTALSLPPPDMISLAHTLGYDAAGIRMLPSAPGGIAYCLMDDPVLLQETLTRMDDTGLRIFDLEMIRIDEHFHIDDFLPFLETGARLGAKAVLVAGNDPIEARLIESYGTLCDTAWPLGLSADLEFMPWTVLNNIASTVRILQAVDRPGCGILIDALHFARSDGRLEEIEALPRRWLHYAQMCDGPRQGPDAVEGLIHAARCDRLLPGEGEFDLAGLFGHLPADLPISLEIPNDRRTSELGPQEWVRQVLEACQALMKTIR
ncbi:TIM barrel protein [Castellaniella sp. GW247-6E4]|uniref:sugar phosphate isomerase/epimerase family protein n=1 Tax=Castellaniella sp. GW247-6E4 TaxID=3140380 RepID=UPI003314CF5A